MLLDRRTLRSHLRWMVVVGLLSLAAAAWFIFAAISSGRVPGGSSAVGLSCGILASVIMVFEFLIWPRKRLRGVRGLGSASAWLRAHIWLGLFTIPLILFHSGISFGGNLTSILSAIYIAVIASGIFGLAMQQWIPKKLLADLPNETVFSQLAQVQQRHYFEAEELMTQVRGRALDDRPLVESEAPALSAAAKSRSTLVVGATRQVIRARSQPGELTRDNTPANSESLATAYAREIRPFLLGDDHYSSPLARANSALQYFAELRDRVDPDLHAVVERLESCCSQRRQLVVQRKLHHWLHGWLLVHLPLSAALLALMFVHAYFALKYR